MKNAGKYFVVMGFMVMLCTANGTVALGVDLPVPSGLYPTIQSAVDAAWTGDRIIVQPGVYAENIIFHGIDIRLMSTDPTNPAVVTGTVIQGTGTDSVVTFDGLETGECELSGFTITGGDTTGAGGGINGNDTNANIDHCVITSNESDHVEGAILGIHGTIRDCVFSYNHSGIAGGGISKM